jgi:Ca2+-binding EF-hand superfamily protein/CRP-like cAMP-binding protein
MDTNIFKIFDEDGDGHITFKEFKKIWKNIGADKTDKELLGVFNSLDIDENGTLEYEELKDFFDTKFESNNIDSINESSDIIDKNRDKYISLEEFETIISRLKLDVSYHEIEKYFNYDESGKISIKQFTNLIVYSDTNYTLFSILGTVLAFMDQCEINYLKRDMTKIQIEELITNYRWLILKSPFNMSSRGRIYSLLRNMIIKKVSYNQKIISIGDNVKYCYIIFSGECKLTINTKKIGNITDIAILGTGSIPCIHDITHASNIYNYNLISMTSSELWCIPINDFKHILKIDHIFRDAINELSNLLNYVYKRREKILKETVNNMFSKSRKTPIANKPKSNKIKPYTSYSRCGKKYDHISVFK